MMHTCQPKAKQREVFIQENMHMIFDKVIFRHGVSPNPVTVKALMNMLPSERKKNCSHPDYNKLPW